MSLFLAIHRAQQTRRGRLLSLVRMALVQQLDHASVIDALVHLHCGAIDVKRDYHSSCAAVHSIHR